MSLTWTVETASSKLDFRIGQLFLAPALPPSAHDNFSTGVRLGIRRGAEHRINLPLLPAYFQKTAFTALYLVPWLLGTRWTRGAKYRTQRQYFASTLKEGFPAVCLRTRLRNPLVSFPDSRALRLLPLPPCSSSALLPLYHCRLPRSAPSTWQVGLGTTPFFPQGGLLEQHDDTPAPPSILRIYPPWNL